MRKIVLWCALVLLAAATWAQVRKDAATEKTIANLEQQWLKGQRANDMSFIEPLIAEGFTNTSADGKVTNRAESMVATKATIYTTADYLDVKVMVFGSTAIAIGGFRGKGTDSSGKPLDLNERWTDTWVKMPSGKWQCVASAVSPIT